MLVSVLAQEAYKQTLLLMGCRFDITVVANSKDEGNDFIKSAIDEIKRIEGLISSWDDQSQTSVINRNAGIKEVIVGAELFELIKRSVRLSALTDGAFDISYASMDCIWKFDGSMKNMPSNDVIKASVAKVGYENIILDNQAQSVFLANKGMKIGFGAIGKGYAADMAKALLVSKGVKAGIVNASGDINSWGQQPNGQEWKVAIINPLNKNKTFAILPISDGAVVTSGDYEKYVEFNHERYSHIIDPRTGYPSKGVISTTIFASSAELADALATSVFVMGVEAGINMINQLPKVECVIIDDDGKVHKSDNIVIENMNNQ